MELKYMKGLAEEKAQIQFLELLRAGLWKKDADKELFAEKETDWKKILGYARMQAVGPLIYDGLVTLPEDMRPELPALYRLMAFADKIERLNAELDTAAGELSERLSAEGIRSVLLKGQGNAALYPDPSRRQCGDIDLYVGKQNFGRSMELFRQWGIVDEVNEPTIKHINFKWGGITVELHKIAFELSESSKSFEEWETASLRDTSSTVMLGGKPVLTPPPTFNAFFVFVHAFHHFMTGGIGLRQLCDLSLILTKLHDRIDGAELQRRLRMYGLSREWDFFCRLCCEDLGMDAEMAFSDSATDEKTRKKAVKFHDFIFEEGNFGQYKKGKYYFDKPYLVRKTISFWKHNVRYFHRFEICPAQTLRHYAATVRSGVAAVMKHK